jgi:hypothetical protein
MELLHNQNAITLTNRKYFTDQELILVSTCKISSGSIIISITQSTHFSFPIACPYIQERKRTMTALIANLQIQAFNALVAAPETIARLEVAISEADEIFQEEIAPLICIAPVLLAEGVILAVKWFIKASYWTFIAGQEIRDWYENEWVGQFALAPMIEEPTSGSLFIFPCLSEPDRSIVIAVPQAQAKAEQPCDRIAKAQSVESPVADPAPKDMHIEVERMLQATAAPAVAEAELVGALDIPGATGKRTSRAKASTSKAGMKPKGTRAKAKV